MKTRPMVPGSLTEQVANAGGEALRLQLSTLLAGHAIDIVAYALTTELGLAALQFGDTEAEAAHVIDLLARDAKNMLALNWDLHDDVTARAAAIGDVRRC